MKSERVTRTWEFYRNNCDGFKESMRKELRKLDGYVSSIESENARMRDLLQEMLGACCVYHRCDFQCQYSYRANLKKQCRLRDKARDLGIEVG